MKLNGFLTAQQQASVVDAVRLAEKGTSGEIRIHIDRECKVSPMERAKEVFNKLGMFRTAQRNGVLIYLAVESKVFAIIGDKGINDLVPENFWADVVGVMGGEFRKGRFAEGLALGATLAGEKLKAYFPYQEDDINELPDEISFEEKEDGR